MDELFERWIKAHGDKETSFIKDGIPFPEIYKEQSPKVLFILKEPNDKEGKNPDQIKFYREFALGLSNDDCRGLITKIGLLHKAIWNQEGNERDSIKKIAFMNLKKSGGYAVCNNKELACYIDDYKTCIIEQINEINPDYIVCLGSFDFLVKYVLLNKDTRVRRWRKANINIADKVYKYRTKAEHPEDKINYKVIFNMYHPSMRGISRNDYVENFKNNYKAVMDDIKKRDIK